LLEKNLLRQTVNVTLNGPGSMYQPGSSILNQFIISVLAGMKTFQFVPERSKPPVLDAEKDSFTVEFESRPLEQSIA
jgi:hypothetical protein